MDWLALAGGAAAAFVYPASCPSCRDAVTEEGGLCAACWRETGFIAPPACHVCGAPTEFDHGEGVFCESCRKAPPLWSRGVAAVTYGGVGRKLALALKHGDRVEIASLAAGWMLRAQGGAGAALVAGADLIAPAPLHWRRMLRRRYNQAGELARELSRAAGRKEAMALDLLTRVRFTGSQEGKSRRERRENVAGAFAVSRKWRARVAGRRVLLVDDVLTTGSTLSGCADACLAAGATEVNVIVFARVASSDPAP